MSNNNPLWQQCIYRRDGELVLSGQWCPLVLAKYIYKQDIVGKKILDIGANTGGLSLELARMGAEIYAVEPVSDTSTAKQIAKSEHLGILFDNDKGLFDCHELNHFDVVLCFGLIYHFRNPAYVLDYLSSLNIPILYISTQTAPGEELKLVNRASGILSASFELKKGTRGWHPTHSMFRRMLEASGYDNIELLTDREYNFPEKPKGATNSAYYRANLAYAVPDPKKLNEKFEARHKVIRRIDN